MDELNVYISNSQCNLIECLYDEDMPCKDCIKRMIAEHDAKVRAEMQEFVEKRCKDLGIDYTLIFTCEGVS